MHDSKPTPIFPNLIAGANYWLTQADETGCPYECADALREAEALARQAGSPAKALLTEIEHLLVEADENCLAQA